MSDVFESFADLDALAEELRSNDAGRRRVAVIGLADSGDPEAVPLLAVLSDDPDVGVRRQAAIALGSFDGLDVATALARALVDDNEDVASAAAESLAELKDADAASPILSLVDHPSKFVRENAFRSLKELRNRDALEPALKALRDPEACVRVQAVGVLGGHLRIEDTLPALRHAASDQDVDVRRVAVSALVFSRSQGAAITIASALGDSNWSVRDVAAESLARSPAGVKNHSDELIKTVDDAIWQVRLSAIRSLGKLEVRRSAARIALELGHAQPNVRKEAAAALGAIKTASRQALLAAADDSDPDVRKNVKWALQQLDRSAFQ